MNVFDYLLKEDFLDDFLLSLVDWKVDSFIPNFEHIYNFIPDKLFSEYTFEGKAYRGLVVDSNLEVLEERKFSSWTTNLDISRKFAVKESYSFNLKKFKGYDQTKGIVISSNIKGLLVEKIIKDALKYKEYIEDETMRVVESSITRFNENEILAPFTINDYDLLEELEIEEHF